MTRSLRLLAVLAAALAAAACSTVTYYTDADSARSTSGDRSFAWYELTPPGDRDLPRAVPNTIVLDRVRRAVEGELGRRGLTAAPVADADLLVTAHVVADQHLKVYHSGGWGWGGWGGWGPCCGWGWGGWGGWGGGFSSAEVVSEGTLVVDVLDATSRRLVWRGVAEGAFPRPNPSDERVTELVARLFASYPAS